MNASLIAAGLALGTILAAPAASAQASCADLTRLLAEAETDFDDIAGEQVDVDYFDTTFRLPGAQECLIDYAWDSIYSCVWRFSDEAAATQFARAQIATMRSCLPAGKWLQEEATPDVKGEWRLMAGASFSAADSGEMVFSARADALTAKPGTYEVMVDLTYFFF
jgi:hypothetical protein